MKNVTGALSGCLVAMALLARAAVAAEVHPLAFVHALQEKGYHDIAVEYLNAIKQQPSIAPELKAVWDLEMSKSLRGSANRALNAKEFEELMNGAQSHLDKFLKENPNHTEAVTAMVSWGTFSIDRALQQLRAARQSGTDQAEKERHLAEARKSLEEAKPRLKQAAETLWKRLEATPVPEVQACGRPDREARAALERRNELVQNLLNARFQAAMADYYSAQTYTDPKADARKSLLQSAAKQLDDIFQANRVTAAGSVNAIGLYAHMWHGKIAEELGDLQLATDIYEEVLANDPGPNVTDKVLDPLFAQVQEFYFGIMARKDPDVFLEEAPKWLKDYARKSGRTEGYQAVALDVVKAKIEQAGKATGADKNKLIAEVTLLLNEMVKVGSPYQQEALVLRKKYAKVETGKIEDAKTVEEAIAIGKAAAGADQWPEALAAYNRALEMAASAKTKDPKRAEEIRGLVAEAKYMVAYRLFADNKLEECLAATGKIIQEDKETPAAQSAGSLAVQATLNLFATAPDQEKRQAALERLEKVCKMVQETWPNRPAADDAHMAMAQVNLMLGKNDEALGVFEKVNPKSERYPLALYLAARTYWMAYVKDKVAGADKEKLAAERAKALQRATDALAGFRKAAEANRPLSTQHVESQLLVAIMHLDAKEFKEAAALLEPLVSQVKASKPQALDEGTVRIFRAALQAYLGLGDVAKGSDVGLVLCDLGADSQPINAILVEFARVLDEERKKAAADVTRATAAADVKAAEAANAKLKSTQSLIGSMLKKLASRKDHSETGLIVLGDLCVNVGMAAEATEIYQRLLAIPNVDKKAATRARAQLVDLLRSAGNFDQAIEQARQLATDNPRSLEPQMVLGRCLQAQAEKDPTKYDDAIGHWTRIRGILQGLRNKPPEYYDVIYNAAWCLYAQAYQTQEKIEERCTQAVSMLKSALAVNEKLNGPDMVAKYNALLDTIQKYTQQAGGAAPAPAAENK